MGGSGDGGISGDGGDRCEADRRRTAPKSWRTPRRSPTAMVGPQMSPRVGFPGEYPICYVYPQPFRLLRRDFRTSSYIVVVIGKLAVFRNGRYTTEETNFSLLVTIAFYCLKFLSKIKRYEL